MRTLILVLGFATMACSASVTNNPGSDGGSGNDGSSSGDGSMASEGGPQSGGGPIDISASCPATPCGGSVEGTWDYTHGCITDPFKNLKTMCPSLQVSNQKGTVNGSVTFQSGTVKRSGTATYSAQVTIPAECTQGLPCSTFNGDGITCTGAGACACNVSKTENIADSDTYTVQGTKVVTGGGNEYAYCVQGSKLTYTETGSNVQHEGVFDLAKR